MALEAWDFVVIVVLILLKRSITVNATRSLRIVSNYREEKSDRVL